MVILPSNVLEKQHNTSPEFKRDGCITLEFILTMQPNYCCRHWSQTNAFSAPSIIQCVFCSDWQPSPLEVCYSELLKPPAESEALCSHDNPEGHTYWASAQVLRHTQSQEMSSFTQTTERRNSKNGKRKCKSWSWANAYILSDCRED